jgi:hypothetical protein
VEDDGKDNNANDITINDKVANEEPEKVLLKVRLNSLIAWFLLFFIFTNGFTFVRFIISYEKLPM